MELYTDGGNSEILAILLSQKSCFLYVAIAAAAHVGVMFC